MLSFAITDTYGDTITMKLFPQYTSLVQTDVSEGTERVIFFEDDEKIIPPDGSTFYKPPEIKNVENTNFYYNRDLLVGRSEFTTYSTYLVFSIADKSLKSDLLNDVSIDTVELKMLLHEIPNNIAGRTLLSVYACYDDWQTPFVKELQKEAQKIETDLFEDKDSSINSCRISKMQGLDSILIHRDELPKFFTLDVTPGILAALKSGKTEIIFVITSVEYLTETQTQETSNLLSMSSLYLANDPEYPYGINSLPASFITYTIESSKFNQIPELLATQVLPSIALIAPAAFWFYKKYTKNKK
jgi:hypothetical protein